MESTNPRILTGVVISNKADKTITVKVERKVKHPIYGKVIKRASKVHVHDENNAASIGDIYSVSCLLENSANPNLESDSGLTPLHLSVKSNSLGVTDLLLSSHGINMNPRDDLYQMTPLQFAVSQALKTRNFAIVKVMMKTQGIDTDIEDALGLNVFAKAHLEGIELNEYL